MTPAELPPSAANLQRIISSSTTCDNAVVGTLRAILFCEASIPRNKTPVAGSSRARTASSTKRATSKSQRQRTVPVREDSKPDVECLDTSAKTALATNVINEAFKSLTKAAQARQDKSAQARPTPSKRTSNAVSSKGPGNPAQTPLRPVSGNKNITPRSTEPKSRLSIDVDRRYEGVRAQALCAFIAFESLFDLQKPAKPTSEISTLQIEKGLSALVQRCLILEMYDLAMKALSRLRRRLIWLRKEQTEPQEVKRSAINKAGKVSSDTSTSEPNANLTDYGVYRTSSPLLHLVATSQLQALRAYAAIGIDDPLSLLAQMQVDNPGSPASIIRQQINPKVSETAQTAAHELELLAQLVLKLGENLKPRIEETHPYAKDFALHRLQLHNLALKIRASWWSLSQHEVDIAKDLWSPLTRSLSTFCRSATCSKVEKYSAIRQAFDNVANLVPSNSTGDQKMTPIYRLMLEMAQAAGHKEEVILWLQKLSASTQSEKLPLLQCLVSCQTATLHLRDLLNMVQVSFDGTSLEGVAKQLTGDLDGTSEDLDDLLIATVSLRKSACTYVLTEMRKDSINPVSSRREDISTSLTLTARCVNFLKRYLGNKPEGHSGVKVRQRFEHRRKLISSIISSTIDSICTVAKVFSMSFSSDWDTIDQALIDCSTLALVVRESEEVTGGAQDGSDHGTSPALFLSRSYWYRYVHLKRTKASFNITAASLRTSIDFLKRTSSPEQSAGLLPLKLEQYASLHESAGHLSIALQVCREGLLALEQLGIIAQVSKASSRMPFEAAFEEDDQFKLLARALQSYIRLSSKLWEKDKQCSLIFDVKGIADDQRLVLFIYQLSILLSNSRSRCSAASYTNAIRCLWKVLFDTCTSGLYPVRHLALIIQMLYVGVTQPSAVEDSVLSCELEAYHEYSSGSQETLDSGLQAYVGQLADQLKLLVAIRRHETDLQAINEVLLNWLTLLQTSADEADLRLQVYDMSLWRSQIQLVTEFLEYQNLPGLQGLAHSVLQLFYDKSNEEGNEALLANVIELGLQYGRLGSVSLAATTLKRAKHHLDNRDHSLGNKVRWNLAMAELALECNNHGSWSVYARLS